jgi:hypothetical protein
MIVRFRSAVICFALVAFAASAAGARADSWNEFSYLSDGFAVSGPSVPTQSKQSVDTAVGPVETRTWVWPDPVLIVVVNDYPSLNNQTEADILSNAAGGEVGKLEGGRITSKTPIVLQGVNGLECFMDGDAYRAHTRIYFQGHRMWQLIAIGPIGQPVDAQINRMFASFRFLQTKQSGKY